MITAYVNNLGVLRPVVLAATDPLPYAAVWIDLLRATTEETKAIEHALGLDLPTIEEMREIEVSSRLYQENGAFFLTATLLTHADTTDPQSTPVTFVLSGHRLITLRHAEPQSFRIFASQTERPSHGCNNGEAAFMGLLDAIIDRLADILERVQLEMDALSREVFAPNTKGAGRHDFHEILKRIGRGQTLTSKTRESLVSLARILSFLGRPGDTKPDKQWGRNIKTLASDVTSLSDHASFLANNINFLLDATLGMLNIEQNGIIKIFSIAAVVFLPPTLIASIYGMNFEFMPELHWPYAYPIAVLAMVISAILPLAYFKRRGWL